MINENFFKRSSKQVAIDILGKVIVRKLPENKILRARIIETEAYFDERDPASRACQNGDLRKTMQMKPGTILVYGVHNNWLMNFVTDKEGVASAVLIRALEPLNFNLNCSGPGLLTKALAINKTFHKKDIFSCKDLFLEEFNENKEVFEVISDYRIGIKNDLNEKLRFYLKDNKHVSKK